MSRTTDFINNEITRLSSALNALQTRRENILQSVLEVDAAIAKAQVELDELNIDLQKTSISKAELISVRPIADVVVNPNANPDRIQ